MASGTTEAEAGDNATDDKKDDAKPTFETVTIEWRGKSWKIPKERGLWDMNVQFEFDDGRRMRGFLILLAGSLENLDAVRAQVYSVARTNFEVDELMDLVAEIANKECVG